VCLKLESMTLIEKGCGVRGLKRGGEHEKEEEEEEEYQQQQQQASKQASSSSSMSRGRRGKGGGGGGGGGGRRYPPDFFDTHFIADFWFYSFQPEGIAAFQRPALFRYCNSELICKTEHSKRAKSC
jgi:hypothetical protein